MDKDFQIAERNFVKENDLISAQKFYTYAFRLGKLKTPLVSNFIFLDSRDNKVYSFAILYNGGNYREFKLETSIVLQQTEFVDNEWKTRFEKVILQYSDKNFLGLTDKDKEQVWIQLNMHIEIYFHHQKLSEKDIVILKKNKPIETIYFGRNILSERYFLGRWENKYYG